MIIIIILVYIHDCIAELIMILVKIVTVLAISHSFVIDLHTHSASWAIWIDTASEYYSSS